MRYIKGLFMKRGPLNVMQAGTGGTSYALRDAEFLEWLKVADIPLPVEPMAREIAKEVLRRAFNAGWAGRKKAVDYKIN